MFYRGFREGKGIWGTWEITIRDHGGFHIWPRQAGEGEARAESASVEEPVDAIATQEIVSGAAWRCCLSGVMDTERSSDEYMRWRTCLSCEAADSKKLLRRQFQKGGICHAIGCRFTLAGRPSPEVGCSMLDVRRSMFGPEHSAF